MKKLLFLALLLAAALPTFAQSSYNFQRRSLFEVLPIHSNDIVFLGNSITDGCEWAELFDNPRIKNRGISADRTGWMLERLDPIVKGHPKKLFLLIGTNDLAAGIAPQTVVDNIRRILERFRTESPRTKLYVQSIFPVNGVDAGGKTRKHWSKGAEIIETNKLLQELCRELDIPYLDIYSVLVDERGLLDKRYTNDGLHLTGEGYLVWKKAIEQYVK